jgi:hypothetical protein
MIVERAMSHAFVAVVLERFVDRFDFAKLSIAERSLARRELALLLPSLTVENARLAAALERLGHALETARSLPQGNVNQSRRLQRLLRWLAPLALGSAAATVGAVPALAYTAPVLGGTVVNPQTGTNETVVEVIDGGFAVRTSKNNLIFLPNKVGDTYSITKDGVTTTYTVTAVTETAIGAGPDAPKYVTAVEVENSAKVVSKISAVTPVTYTVPPAGGANGSGTIYPTFPVPAGNEQFQDIRAGANGASGRNGGGVNLCIPFTDICAFVGVTPTAGGKGANGPDFSAGVPANYSGGTISSTADALPGIKIASVGGSGGKGGNSISLGGEAAAGGGAGNGGNVAGVNLATVSTSGKSSHGMWVLSQAGSAGAGGTGVILANGGGGGGAAAGGSASGSNYGSITTQGDSAVGLAVQSLGGGGGTGGGSYGIVGSAGTGSIGGNGGDVTALNAGTILTRGKLAYGVQALSIGGNGGSSGDSAGIVAFGGTAGGAGTGGKVAIILDASSKITTTGDYAHAALAQSIGGGGGSTGWSGGAVSFGGSAGIGGTGGAVNVNAADGSTIETFGKGAYGVYAESVGGNGGTVGGTGGIVTLGGTGGSGNTGGSVDIVNGGRVATHGIDAIGVFAQSVGGGGGSANASGGLVSLGGSGGSGGTGGAVTVTLGGNSAITTEGKGATGAFAQSIGGGGGLGAASGGLVALGGSGSVGGNGGVVRLTNAGSIQTAGDLSLGMFAQSVGGGGGSGGDGGGLVAIGGSGAVASDGGNVTLANSGTIRTEKNRSSAIQVQSVGGGGGSGGITGGVLVTVGGSGAGGGIGGTVIANVSGGLETGGNDSHGLYAQSVGGGGGNGGASTSVSAFIGLAIGGKGAGGGKGGDVTANFTQTSVNVGGSTILADPLITTQGDRSRGVLLQSVGGGGGSGGAAVQVSAGAFGAASFAIGGSAANGSEGGIVRANGKVAIKTAGNNAEGFFAQSVGGGGGNGGSAISVAASAGVVASGALSIGIGGKGGGGGKGGTVEVDSGGNIVTTGQYSTGFVAQSVGGGGGKGGYTVSVAAAVANGLAVTGALGIGGSGGAGGLGGNVTAAFDGDITTGDPVNGSDSGGAIIQSVGGGGGSGGFNVSAAVSLGSGAAIGAAVGLGGSGGNGGYSGVVKGTIGGNVVTRGERSTGVVIQSVGGGGGSGGFNVSGNIGLSGGVAGGVAVGLGGSGGGGGYGGEVTGTALGTVETFAKQSDAVVIQSIGGGGGSGGFNVSGNLNFGGTAGVSIGVGLGGNGGGAGAGGNATGTVADAVVTHGDLSRGVVVQSVGGGGGAGAFNITGGISAGGTFGGTLGIGLGGNGGGGGGAGNVIASAKSVTTFGEGAAAFIAQSVGGGGGVGGFNVTGGLGFGGSAAGTIGFGLGGSGGGGGSAGMVTASLAGVATTGKFLSGAIVAQSIGGGGGTGSFNVTGGITGAGTGSGTLNIGVGGSGGTAGNGGEVLLNVAGMALTAGGHSAGIVAQSIGGGGGSGAFNVSGGIAAAGTGAGQVSIGVGGRGGGGGSAEAVTLNVNNGTTVSDDGLFAGITRGDASAGIVAQSVGGGGGNGGYSISGGVSLAGTGAGGVNIGVGGSGGTGGHAGNVLADISGATVTSGDVSSGVVAQSVGGGGGDGAVNISGGLTIGGTGSGMFNIGVGGSGGDGGYAGDATLRINDQVATPGQELIAAVTRGRFSNGVVVQSLGGGGGNGGFNVTGSVNLAGTGSGAVNIGVGGMGGTGASSGAATADITGGIATTGEGSPGLLVQSIGGGGGNGAFNVSAGLSISRNAGSLGIGVGGFGGDGGNGRDVRLDLNQRTLDPNNTLAAVSTAGEQSAGIIVQSLGGGGGNGGFNITAGASIAKNGAGNIGVGVGGFGGGGGDAARATANIRGDIITRKDLSSALLVQSLGGGGGNGGFNVTAGLSISKGANGNFGFGIGGFGGAGGDGKAVFANVESDIQTNGLKSKGATIQSLGGGGGNGGFNVTGGVSLSLGTGATGNLGVGIGGFGGSGGDADEVTAALTGNVQTLGVESYGVLVQSAGGGGGDGAFNVTGGIAITKGANGNIGVGVGGLGGDGGTAKKVTATMTGNVLTTRESSFGVTFQSMGGGGGNGGFNVTGGLNVSLGDKAAGNVNVGIGGFAGGGGDGGKVDGKLFGNVQTAGQQSGGILMQSVGGGGGNGGMNISGGIAFSQKATGSIGFGLGGFGGDGGDGETVDALARGNVTTEGAQSYGAIFQSLGGAGGNGAMNVTGSINITKGDATSGGAAIGIGGFGGGGGNAKRVTAESVGLYQTRGDNSNGVVAQSVGGGGGNGGMNVSGQIGFSTQGKGGGLSFGLGGFGGDGGTSGDVTLIRAGQTITRGISSHGVVAQSLGGGGGLGALNVAAGIAGTRGGDSGTVVIGIGGFGGGGGNAANVTATIMDSVWATGSDAETSFVPDDFVFAVDNENQTIEVATKTHLLNGSHGILVQSQGGGGGSGGVNISGGISLAQQQTGSKGSALVLGVGGFGGGGGDAGIVDATIGSASGPRIQVQGRGDARSAVYVASVGGGGGDGAINISGGITTDGSIVAGVGGSGGGGGLGRDVIARVDADLFAKGYQASGLAVQSIGGGGGNGGLNISGGIRPRNGNDPVIVYGMGGDGGAGNSSGNVTVQQDGQVFVDGYNSHGVLIQSIAGGGGDGGMDIVANVNKSNGESKIDGFAAAIGIGGTGGQGSKAGDVLLRSTGNILINTNVITDSDGTNVFTAGSQAGLSVGVQAQSIGGGGGSGGFNLVGTYANNGQPMTIGVGGSGGVGGDAGAVTVRRGYREDGSVSASTINTMGFGSTGLVAQSIGGGGGSAATNLTFATAKVDKKKTAFGGLILVGGDGKSSGDGKSVTVDHVGSIATDGQASEGLLAQSIGKGGGNAAVNIGVTKIGERTEGWNPLKDSTNTSTISGAAVAIGGAAGDAGSAGAVSVRHAGTIVTRQVMSRGLVAQSLAGGGGNVALNSASVSGDNTLSVAIGREGGKGGTAGAVTIDTAGTIATAGQLSDGIVGQSIGGAGGLSGTISVSGQVRDGSGTDSTKNGMTLAVGLEGGAGGHGGTVTINNRANVTTDGLEARGIIAQSIGGDGGVGGTASTKVMGQLNSVAVTVGGGGGSGAISSKVTVANAGNVVTKGATSDGILAQSIGGSGGVGGAASTWKAPLFNGADDKIATTVAIAVGGGGGSGAIAGDVAVVNAGVISTTTDRSFGVRAQSIGGGGGVGGATFNIETQAAKTVNTYNLLIGAGGGDGNLAGRVDVTNRGVIQTTGIGAIGISANSIGGSGGDAGSVSNLTILKAGGSGEANALQLSIGGGGGSGGRGGVVHVVNTAVVEGEPNTGTILTTGSDAHGIFAQSLGGGGGNGSSIASLLLDKHSEDGISIGLNLGGGGGSGNTADEVTVENAGLIVTKGDGSFGILAQSIGGGGGNGGLTLSANVRIKSRSKAPLMSIGGVGGAGNNGGHVAVINTGRILTEGKGADGIVAQSIGGGGGNAGLAVALTGETKTLVASNLMGLLVGGLGGGISGLGGQVDVTHSGDITVLGKGSQAIIAESINGGGGHAHFDTTGIVWPTLAGLAPDVNLNVGDLGALDGIPNLVKGEPTNRPVEPVIVAARVGANEARSMNAGSVNVTITGTMNAGGDYGTGSTLRSVGGGGGTVTLGGSLIKAEVPAGTSSVGAQAIYAVGMGAKNSDDSAGADIASKHDGQVVTTGKASTGVLMQSIGGGGGSALVDLQAEDVSDINSVRLGLGAVGTSNSDGGAVSRTQTGAVFTTQDQSHGALVQSIGGGGGSAIAHVGTTPAASATAKRTVAAAATASADRAVTALVTTTAAAEAAPAPAIVSLGATGGTGNDGGAIDLSFSGGFSTQGAHAVGLIAQSIGGGGGSVVLDGLQASRVIVGGQAGATGSGGTVAVANNGAVVTGGANATGILLQSIGGGGGVISGDVAATAVKLSTANNGYGGAVKLKQKGDVVVSGDGSTGIIAQSLGGGGGLIGSSFAGSAGGLGSGGSVALDVQGSVLATGAGSTAIVAQSVGSQGVGDIAVTTSGNVRGGSIAGAAIRIDGGENNVVRSAGTLSAVSGMAVIGGIGNDRVVNAGLAVGNFQLGGGSNALENAAGATLVTIETIDLRDGAGSSGTFTNAGQVSLGLSASPYPLDLLAGATLPERVVTDPKGDLLNGTSIISRVALDGDFVQTKTGNTSFDVAFGPYASDRIDVTGRATVDGTADVTLRWLENSAPVLLWSATGGGVDNGLSVRDTLAIDYRTIADGEGIKLGLTSNFGLSFLTNNQQAIGQSLDSALTVGNASGLGRLMALLGNLGSGQEATYQGIIAELDPEPLLAPGLVQFASAQDFGRNLFGCNSALDEGKCVWGHVQRNQYDRNGQKGDATISQDDSAFLRAGLEVPFEELWALAGAIGYDDNGRLDFDRGRAYATSRGVHAGLAVRRAIGSEEQGAVSLGVSGGVQWGDMDRRQTVFVDAIGRSRFRNDYVALNANTAYTLTAGRLFARPELNLSYVGVGQGNFQETQLLGLGVQALRHRDWIATATPVLTLGAKLGEGAQLSVNGGAVLHDKSDYTAPFRLLGADRSATPATIRTGFDRTGWTAGVDLNLMRADKFSVDAGYRAEWGETTTVQSLRLKAHVAF